MQEQVLLLLVLLFSQALADMNLNITSPTACTTSDNSNTVETTLYGVSGFLISFVGLIPGAEPFAAGLSALYSVWGSYDNGGSGGTDYTNDLANCLKEWVGAEIDDSLWRQATPLHGDAIKAVGEIHTLLNGSSEITLTPYQIMDKSQTHYERINQDRLGVQSLYAGTEGGSYENATQMLQLNLDLVSLQSQIGLTLLLYGAANRDSIDDFNGDLDLYLTDVEAFIAEQFGNDNPDLSIPYAFDHSPTATDWMNSIQKTSQECGKPESNDYVDGCLLDGNWNWDLKTWCQVYDGFRKYTFPRCEEKCSWWDDCKSKCEFNVACAEQAKLAEAYVQNSLDAIRSHIQETKIFLQEILIQMKNLAGCDCNAKGTESCNLKTDKKCICRPNVTGDKCDTCKEGFYDITTSCNATLILGPQDSGGTCPSPTYSYPSAPGADGGLCCCKPFCCWDKCQLDNPPEDCLSAIPNSKWIWNEEKGYYQAAQIV